MQFETSLVPSDSEIGNKPKDAAVSGPRGFRKWAPLIVLSLALMIIIIDTTILNVSLRTIITDLHTDILGIQWVVTAYSLILAAFTITGGRVGDLFGRKKMFMVGAAIFALGSFIASISKSVTMMIGGEAVIEGIGAVLMMPATASLLVANYKGRDRAVAFGVWGGIAGAAAAIGPILGGWLTTNYSWRWAFRVNVFVAIILLIGSIIISESRDREEKPKMDWIGVVLSSLGLLSIVYGFIKAETYGWFKAKEVFAIAGHAVNLGQMSVVPVFVAIGLIIFSLFLLWERHMDRTGKTPLVSLTLFKNKQFTAGAITTAILALGQAGLIFSIPIFLQGVKGLDAFHTGLFMIPMSITSLLVAPLSAFLVRLMSPKRLVQLGLLVNVAAFLVLRYSLRPDATQLSLAPGFILFGLGLGMIMAQVSNITLSAVSVEEAGEASGVNNTMRQVGATLGSAVLGAIMISTLTSNLGNGIEQSNVIPAAAKQQISQSLSSHASQIEFGSASAFEGNLPQGVKDELSNIIKNETTAANKTTLGYGAMLVLLGFISSFALPGSKDVETGRSAASHADVVAAHEEKIRKFKYRALLLSLLLAAAAAAAGYAAAKHKYQKAEQSAGHEPITAAPTTAQGDQVSGPGVMGGEVKGEQTNPAENSSSTTTPEVIFPRGDANKEARQPATPKEYINTEWGFSFTMSSGREVVAKQATEYDLSLYDAQSGELLGAMQRYPGLGGVSLDAVERQMQGSPEVTGYFRTEFAGLPAIRYEYENGGVGIAVMKGSNLYYISGSIIFSPIAETFRFN